MGVARTGEQMATNVRESIMKDALILSECLDAAMWIASLKKDLWDTDIPKDIISKWAVHLSINANHRGEK